MPASNVGNAVCKGDEKPQVLGGLRGFEQTWQNISDALNRPVPNLPKGHLDIPRDGLWRSHGLHSGNSIRLLRGRSRPDRAIPHIYCPRPFESPLKRETITFVARQRVFFLTFEKRNRGHKGTIPPLTMARGITNSGRTGGCFRVDS